jgi:hypothetical protein
MGGRLLVGLLGAGPHDRPDVRELDAELTDLIDRARSY